MRKKQVVRGFNNSQKMRVMIDGLGLYMTMGDIDNAFATSSHRLAVLDCANALARIRSGDGAADQAACGLAGTFNGKQVQLDLS
jgi:hypothetical protein